MVSCKDRCADAFCAGSLALRAVTTRPSYSPPATRSSVVGVAAPPPTCAAPSACARAADPRSAARSPLVSGWDAAAGPDSAPRARPSPPTDNAPASCIPPGARSRVGHTVLLSSTAPTTTPPQTACASPPLRSLSRACPVVAASSERTKVPTMSPVCSVNHVPGPDPWCTHAWWRGLHSFAASRLRVLFALVFSTVICFPVF